MMKTTKLWKCNKCGAVMEEITPCLKDPECRPLCCGAPMIEQRPQTADSTTEKHVPVASKSPDGSVKVAVGSIPHPMTPEHHIEWIEIVRPDGSVCRKYLFANSPAEAFFKAEPVPGSLLREYCNIHGLWTAEVR